MSWLQRESKVMAGDWHRMNRTCSWSPLYKPLHTKHCCQLIGQLGRHQGQNKQSLPGVINFLMTGRLPSKKAGFGPLKCLKRHLFWRLQT